MQLRISRLQPRTFHEGGANTDCTHYVALTNWGLMMFRKLWCVLVLAASFSVQAENAEVEVRRISSVDTYGTSFLVKSPGGVQVVMDPYMVIDGVRADVVTVTHPHPDHNDSQFEEDMLALGVPLFVNRKMEWSKGDVRVFSVPAMHNPVPVDSDNPTNTIFVVETAGLRIAHFGDLGQRAFTPEQLAALGHIDIAFMQFENAYSELKASEGRAFRLMDALGPRLIIPTHAGGDSWAKLRAAYGPAILVGEVLRASPASLPVKTQVVELAHPTM